MNFHRLSSNRFVRNVIVLLSGTLLAQGIATLSIPILTRLYDPSAFSALAGFASVLAMVSAVTCLRFNVAIPLPERESDAGALLVLSVFSATMFSLVSYVVLRWTPVLDLALISGLGLQESYWLLSIAILLSGVYLTFQSWTARRKAFKRIARTKVTRAGCSVATQVGFGVFNPIPLGLLVGHTVLHGFGFLSLALFAWREDRADLMAVTKERVWSIASTYWRYPVISTPEALLNAAGNHLPVLIIVAFASPAEGGFLFLAMKLMGLPMMLIGRSVTQVYVSEAGDKLREGTLQRFTISSMVSLAKLGILPFLIVGIAAPFLAEPILGQGWERTGILLAWMVPWFFLQFITSPVSVVLLITSRHVLALGMQAFGLVLRVGAIYLALQISPEMISETLAISGAVFYLVYLAHILIVLSQIPKEVL